MLFLRILSVIGISSFLIPYATSMEKSVPTTNSSSVPQSSVRKYCSNCYKGETLIHFQLCSDCKGTRYCCKECQQHDWKRHKPTCLQMQKILKAMVLKHCSNCFKEEASKDNFRLCSACTGVLYCSEECQKHDWKRHKPGCLNMRINEEEAITPQKKALAEEPRAEELKRIKEALISELKQEEFQRIKRERPHLLKKTGEYIQTQCAWVKCAEEEEYEQAATGLSRSGDRYRTSLHEEVLSAIQRGDTATRDSCTHLLLITEHPRFVELYPHEDPTTILTKFKYGLDLLEHFSSRIVNREEWRWLKDNPDAKESLIALLKMFEPHRGQGSLFRDKGYPPEIENSLEKLRHTCMLIFLDAIDAKKEKQESEELPARDAVFFWAYKMACTIPCVHHEKKDELAHAVDSRDYLSLLSCLRHDKIMLHGLFFNDRFAEFVEEALVSADDLFGFVSSNFVQEPVTHLKLRIKQNVMPEEIQKLYKAFGLLLSNDTILFALAAGYFEKVPR